jgi:integrase/recombinase XerD
LHRNTVNNHHDCLKSVLTELQREGHIRISPYSQFSYKDERQHKLPLNKQQLQKIMELDVTEYPRLDAVKDIFLFSCFTGLRFGDALSLEGNKIQKIKEDLYEITIMQKKTEGYVSLPLMGAALDIFKKYDNDARKVTGKVLPQYSNQKFNAYLKEIADLSKIHFSRPLTHHVARHTFATTVCIENGVSMDVVGKWLGHEKIETTQVYAKLNNPFLREQSEKLAEKLNAQYNETKK